MAIEDAYQLMLEISKGAEKAQAAGTSIDVEAVLKSYFNVSRLFLGRGWEGWQLWGSWEWEDILWTRL
jgi:hypothetical protein